MHSNDNPAPAPSRRERRLLTTRRLIRLAALRLAVERGVDNVTVQAISDAADIAPRTFFGYFPSKEAALAPDQPWTAARLRDAVISRPAGEPPLRALRAVMTEMAIEVTAEPELLRLWRTLAREHPRLIERLIGKQEIRVQALTEAVAVRGGYPRDDAYPSLTAAVAWAAGQVAVQRWLQSAERVAGAEWPPVERFIDEAFDLLELGLGDRRTAGHPAGGCRPPIALDHTIVPARDKLAAARFFAGIFGLPFAGVQEPFAPVRVSDTLMLDFGDAEAVQPLHYAFVVGEDQLDAILARVRAAGVPHGSGPAAGWDGQTYHYDGGRGVYFQDPNGHVYEVFTRA